MSLTCLTLQAMFLILVVAMVMERLPRIDDMLLASILVFLDLCLLHVVKDADAELDILNKGITAGL